MAAAAVAVVADAVGFGVISTTSVRDDRSLVRQWRGTMEKETANAAAVAVAADAVAITTTFDD